MHMKVIRKITLLKSSILIVSFLPISENEYFHFSSFFVGVFIKYDFFERELKSQEA